MTVQEAYDASAEAWSGGPDRVFSALAAALLARGPSWKGLDVVDIGAGTGTATRLLHAQGARPCPVDLSAAMLAGAGVVGDARQLPLRSGCFDAAVLGFVLNHLPDPASALAEAARVVRPGGWVLASTWARGREHPVRELVQNALLARGWEVPQWYDSLKTETMRHTDTVAGLTAAAAVLEQVSVEQVDVPVAASHEDMLDWRLGLPHTAPFVASLTPSARAQLRAELSAAVLPPLVCSLVLLTGRAAG